MGKLTINEILERFIFKAENDELLYLIDVIKEELKRRKVK